MKIIFRDIQCLLIELDFKVWPIISFPLSIFRDFEFKVSFEYEETFAKESRTSISNIHDMYFTSL